MSCDRHETKRAPEADKCHQNDDVSTVNKLFEAPSVSPVVPPRKRRLAPNLQQQDASDKKKKSRPRYRNGVPVVTLPAWMKETLKTLPPLFSPKRANSLKEPLEESYALVAGNERAGLDGTEGHSPLNIIAIDDKDRIEGSAMIERDKRLFQHVTIQQTARVLDLSQEKSLCSERSSEIAERDGNQTCFGGKNPYFGANTPQSETLSQQQSLPMVGNFNTSWLHSVAIDRVPALDENTAHEIIDLDESDIEPSETPQLEIGLQSYPQPRICVGSMVQEVDGDENKSRQLDVYQNPHSTNFSEEKETDLEMGGQDLPMLPHKGSVYEESQLKRKEISSDGTSPQSLYPLALDACHTRRSGHPSPHLRPPTQPAAPKTIQLVPPSRWTDPTRSQFTRFSGPRVSTPLSKASGGIW